MYWTAVGIAAWLIVACVVGGWIGRMVRRRDAVGIAEESTWSCACGVGGSCAEGQEAGALVLHKALYCELDWDARIV